MQTEPQDDKTEPAVAIRSASHTSLLSRRQKRLRRQRARWLWWLLATLGGHLLPLAIAVPFGAGLLWFANWVVNSGLDDQVAAIIGGLTLVGAFIAVGALLATVHRYAARRRKRAWDHSELEAAVLRRIKAKLIDAPELAQAAGGLSQATGTGSGGLSLAHASVVDPDLPLET